ncbi:pyridoxamine 5'-phosphate oxidase family protein [Streptomyces noursei]|uniref:pyridoxamine 5'-phosphate oxidase family protein n=1 Tax=Streptomyces noursei TaxID=1971 RepID=UPI001966A0FD|nr:pyridoxamine 5'-phosphate oxidase family protein [Streptomyces noursei]QRX90214.1 pyridoxamine 5'-phosphate oxidase family protein [Streptomyces noursei]
MQWDNGLRQLDRQECLRFLTLVPIGRIVYTHEALPAALPVNFSLDQDHSVVFRTSARSRVVHAVDGAVVAFETDWFDEESQSGWSVVVTGRASLVTDRREQERLRAVGLRSWVAVPEDAFVRITPELVSGRLLHGHPRGGERGTASLADVP